MHSIHDQLFHYVHLDVTVIDVEKKNRKEIKSFADAQRSRFHQLISSQRVLIKHALLEPMMWWFQNKFPSVRYDTLAEQQIDMFRMLHNLDVIVS
jgi:hypothetical protein